MTDTSAQDRIREIGERVNAAAPGPWTADGAEPWDVVVWAAPKPDGSDDLAFNVGPDITAVGSPAGSHDMANAEFIAHAREDVPYLLAQVEALQAQVAALEAAGRPCFLQRDVAALDDAIEGNPDVRELIDLQGRIQQWVSASEPPRARE